MCFNFTSIFQFYALDPISRCKQKSVNKIDLDAMTMCVWYGRLENEVIYGALAQEEIIISLWLATR